MHMLDSNSSVDLVFLDFSKTFYKVDHGIVLHKFRAIGITGNIGIWLFHLLTDRSHFVRLTGGISEDHPVVSSVPHNSLDGGDCLHGGHYTDDLADNSMQLNNQKYVF